MKYPHINIVDGLNLSPVPLEFSQSLTTTKWLGGIESKINHLIDYINEMENASNSYTDEQLLLIQKQIDAFLESLNNGDIIPDNSIDIKKLNPNFLKDLNTIVVDYVHSASKFVTFGLQGDYFVAYIPNSWENIEFGTDEQGRLTIQM